MTSLVSLAADSNVPPLHERELPMAHIMYGLIAIAVFLAMLGFLWMFRNAAAKVGLNDPQPGRSTSASDGSGSGH